MLKDIVIKAIRYYQDKWAQRYGGGCIFEPSCSHYGIQALEKYRSVERVIKDHKTFLTVQTTKWWI